MKVEYDFSKCHYNISVVSSGGLLKAYPELNAFEEFVAAHNDNEIKIVVCLADENSPFLKIKEYKLKVIAIFDYLEMSLKNKKNEELFNEILLYTSDRIFAMCGAYLQMQNNHNFTYWWNTNQLYYSLMNEMGKPMGKNDNVSHYVDRKLKIQKQADPIKNDLEKIEAELFADSKMKMAIAKSKLTKLRTYAEMHAESNTVV